MARWNTGEGKERYLNSRYFQSLCDFERKMIREAIEVSDGDINAAGLLLGVDEETLKQRISRLGGVLEGQPIAKQYTGRWVPRAPRKEPKPSVRSDEESPRARDRKAKTASVSDARLEATEATLTSASSNSDDDSQPFDLTDAVDPDA